MCPIDDEPMLEAYIYETSQIIETLEQVIMRSEQEGEFSEDDINEIFRFMHTIKGSSAMMMYNDISTLAHRIEDIFYLIRENNAVIYEFDVLIDMILESIDFLKIEMMKIREGEQPDGDQEELMSSIQSFYDTMKSENAIEGKAGRKTSSKKQEAKKEEEKPQYYIQQDKSLSNIQGYHVHITFKPECAMENVRAYTVVHNLADKVAELYYYPPDIIDNDSTAEIIQKEGFHILFRSKIPEKELDELLEKTVFLDQAQLKRLTNDEYATSFTEFTSVPEETKAQEIKIPESSKKHVAKKHQTRSGSQETVQTMISVHVEKLDRLMDLVGELVVSEAMVSQNPEITELEIESFEKAARQLHKISNELQDMVMSIRMVPLSTTFMKMHRIVRDMSKKLDKQVKLDVIGEETEVDKNIIEKISDPLMHIIRNSIDHGIEESHVRQEKGKEIRGTVILEAKNSGSDVLIVIKDDGKGLNKQVIYDKAKRQGMTQKAIDEMTEREIFNMILQPGFSTKENVTEFSGRGVGMDVVMKNLENIGGSVIVDSIEGQGTTITLKIPLTLAIIEGMNIRVGKTRFTIPIASIKESFRARDEEIFMDTNGNEMIMVRGLCYPIIRLHELYELPTDITRYSEGILMMVEDEERSCCIFADELLGQQQVVVKSLPEYIKQYRKIKGLSGCTILGDGNISLILDVAALQMSRVKERV